MVVSVKEKAGTTGHVGMIGGDTPRPGSIGMLHLPPPLTRRKVLIKPILRGNRVKGWRDTGKIPKHTRIFVKLNPNFSSRLRISTRPTISNTNLKHHELLFKKQHFNFFSSFIPTET
jgi:hypothetical protein